jgi:hypothetical protein
MSAQIGLMDPQSSPHASGGLDILSKAVSMIVLPEDQNGDLPMKKKWFKLEEWRCDVEQKRTKWEESNKHSFLVAGRGKNTRNSQTVSVPSGKIGYSLGTGSHGP